jgi:hypothetical protein
LTWFLSSGFWLSQPVCPQTDWRCWKRDVSLWVSPPSLHGSRLAEFLVKAKAPSGGPLLLLHNFSINPHLESHGKFPRIRT